MPNTPRVQGSPSSGAVPFWTSRNHFEDLLKAELKEELIQGSLALFFVDLDHFSAINEGLGHQAGDECLVRTGQRLATIVGDRGAGVRFGSDQFVLFYRGADSTTASRVAQELLTKLRQPILFSSETVRLTASVGVACYPEHGGSARELLQRADAAMHRAKESGRNRAAVFDEDVHAQTQRSLSLERDLQGAMERGQFVLHYQPQLGREGLVAMEALLRWKHPTRGLIGAHEFVPLLERSHLMPQVGEWVLHQACEDLLRWQRSGRPGLRMAVNVSAHQLEHPSFLRDLHHAVSETGVSAHDLEIEVTESVLIRDPAWAAQILEALSQMEIRVALDDFGTGYSSLTYLHQFSTITALKIDRSFVRGARKGSRRATFVHSLVAMARSLSMETVAEGIERPAELSLMMATGCDLFQGFLFAKPIPGPSSVGRLPGFTLNGLHVAAER